MTPHKDIYVTPLTTRYASRAMQELFGEQRKFSAWRRMWLALAEAQRELGLAVSRKQLAQMATHLDDIDFRAAERYEFRLRHDLMAHVHTFGDAAPAARPIIHLGATSQDIEDNADLVLMREALGIIRAGLVNVIAAFAAFAKKHRALPCLGFTHFQPAQMTTVGKRATLWCSDFLRDLADIEWRLETLEFRGIKGATGTQASFLALFGGDERKVKRLEQLVARKMGFTRIAAVTGQTYSRKVDAAVAQALAGIGASVHKFCNDVRLLANLKELEEPFETSQVGSSAMAYKRNPMRCERATGLARFLMDVSASPLHTAAEQWLERTLDDSANKRLAMSESFLAADAILRITLNVARGLVVYPATIAAHVEAELPFMATENILMAAVAAGRTGKSKAATGDRQDLHERIRRHSQAAARQVKELGKPNDLLDRLRADPAFAAVDFRKVLDARSFVGPAPKQVQEFLAQEVAAVLRKHRRLLGEKSELRV